MPPRYSFEIGSTSTTFRRLNLEEESNLETQTVDFKTARAIVSSIPTTFRTNLQGIDNSSNIAQPIYTIQKESPQNSPNIKHFYSNKNKQKREDYFKNYNDKKESILQEYYEFINIHKIHIKFFEWFEEYYSESVNTIKHNTKWQTNKGEVESRHPPLMEVQYLHKNTGIKANPLRMGAPDAGEQISLKDIKMIVEQNNYTNINLHTIGKQLDYIENLVESQPIKKEPNKYNATTIYEWNIDGVFEYNVLSLLQQMTMVSNVYKTQNQNGLISDHAMANLLVAGFTSQLKGWWDHALTKTQQEEILKLIKKDNQ
uniref:Uncharacterized protein n=1 Tax=Gossypium raimondii TaxID=29730 RepID=A0A0D2QMP0_GOSRA|nr:hypothetical protein B456_001G087300 [Gossypium raimondii]